MATNPRDIARFAIRDGEAWNDRRLPEVGRALDEALDECVRLRRALRAIHTTAGGYLGSSQSQAGIIRIERLAKATLSPTSTTSGSAAVPTDVPDPSGVLGSGQ